MHFTYCAWNHLSRLSRRNLNYCTRPFITHTLKITHYINTKEEWWIWLFISSSQWTHRRVNTLFYLFVIWFVSMKYHLEGTYKYKQICDIFPPTKSPIVLTFQRIVTQLLFFSALVHTTSAAVTGLDANGMEKYQFCNRVAPNYPSDVSFQFSQWIKTLKHLSWCQNLWILFFPGMKLRQWLCGMEVWSELHILQLD